MKSIELEKATPDAAGMTAQKDNPTLGVVGIDEEQLQLSESEKFRKLISERRNQKTLSRDELEAQLAIAGAN